MADIDTLDLIRDEAQRLTGLADVDALLRLVIEYTTVWGCARLELCMTEGCAMARRLLRHGFIARDERGFQVAVADTDAQASTLRAASSWHLTEADQDLETVFVQAMGE